MTRERWRSFGPAIVTQEWLKGGGLADYAATRLA
jgi:hypothetical protein